MAATMRPYSTADAPLSAVVRMARRSLSWMTCIWGLTSDSWGRHSSFSRRYPAYWCLGLAVVCLIARLRADAATEREFRSSAT